MVVGTIVLNVPLGADVWDQAGDQADEHIGTCFDGGSDGHHDGRQLICTASHDDSV
jgi:hypothetical protein